jgi:hypothetical protein
MIGELKAGDAGNQWVARRYGSEYDTPATFDSQKAAIASIVRKRNHKHDL